MMFSCSCSFATDNYIPIRAGISDNSFKSYIFDSVKFNNANNLTITDSATGYTVTKNENSCILKVTSENNLFRIYLDEVLVARNLTGPIVISSKDNSFIERDFGDAEGQPITKEIFEYIIRDDIKNLEKSYEIQKRE